MSKVSDLIGLGMAPELADRAGRLTIGSVTCAGSAITDAADITYEWAYLPSASAAGAQLPDWPVGSVVFVDNASGQTQSIYPHSATGTINAGSAGAAQTIATAKLGIFIRRTNLDWRYTLIN